MNRIIYNFNYILNQDRIIDTEPSIVIGINGKKQAENRENHLANQCLRLNAKNELYSLQMYEQTDKTLCYEFENDIRLCFIKHNNDILYNLKTPNTSLTKKMNNTLVKNFKSLHFGSPEFDLIEIFLKNND